MFQKGMKNEDWRQKTEVWKTEDGRTQNPPVRRSFSEGGKPGIRNLIRDVLAVWKPLC